MRIIDKRKDYYDCIQKTGQDESLIYIRKTRELESKYYASVGNTIIGDMFITRFIVGFCGKIYPGVKIGPLCQCDEIFYDFKKMDEYLMQNMQNKYIEKYIKTTGHTEGRKSLLKFFERDYGNLINIFSYNIPIFTIYKDGKDILCENPLLNELKFFKVFNPYMAFQELSMYLGSLAVPIKEIPVLDDITMRDIKGFNKFSFRKDKSL